MWRSVELRFLVPFLCFRDSLNGQDLEVEIGMGLSGSCKGKLKVPTKQKVSLIPPQAAPRLVLSEEWELMCGL